MKSYTKKEGIYQPRTEEAYAVFDCNAPKARIEDYLQGRLSQSPEGSIHDCPDPRKLGLELKLEEVQELVISKNIDPKLERTIRTEGIISTYPEGYKHLRLSAKPTPLKDLKYVITAKNGNSNADAAEKLLKVMNGIYLRFGEKKPFAAVVLGKDDNGDYSTWENN
jgi:hypothetical protein